GDPGDEVAEPRRDAVQDREDHARVRRPLLVREPGLEVVQVLRQRVPGQRRRPRNPARPGPVRDQQPDDDETREDEAIPPPGPRSRSGDGLDPLGGDGHQAGSPAIASSTASRSTTPTTLSPSTAQTGRSLFAITGTARRTVVSTSSFGPSSSPGFGSRM